MMVKGKVTHNQIFITLDKEEKQSGLVIVDEVNKDKIKERQKVVGTGPQVQSIEEGDEILINFDRYYKERKGTPTEVQGTKKYYLEIPIIEIAGETYGRIIERDVIYAYGEEE